MSKKNRAPNRSVGLLDNDMSNAVLQILPRSRTQKVFMDSILENNITFGKGSAGTGKTYIATILACQALHQGLTDKIIICRPIVEAAGERIGFLPGTLEEKCDPYIQPMADVINEYFNPIKKSKNAFAHMSSHLSNQIEVQALAFMRGRSYKNAWIICDEAQNMDAKMMKMLITRFGQNCKMIITGDPAQRDRMGADGFEAVERHLSKTPNIAQVTFGPEDIVRHETVQDILSDWPDE